MPRSPRLRHLLLALLAAAVPVFAAPADDIAKLIGEKKYSEAEAALRPILKGEKVDPAILKLAVSYYESQGKYFSASTPMSQLLDSGETDPSILFRAAVISEATADFSKAVTRYRSYFENAKPDHPLYRDALRNLCRVQVLMLNNPSSAADTVTDYINRYGVDPQISYEVRQVLGGLAGDGNSDRFYELMGLVLSKVPAAEQESFLSVYWSNSQNGKVAYRTDAWMQSGEFLLRFKVTSSNMLAAMVIPKLTLEADMNKPSQTTREKRLELGRQYGMMVMDSKAPADWPEGILAWTMSGFLKSNNAAVAGQAAAVFAKYDEMVWATNDATLRKSLLSQMVTSNPPPADAQILQRLHRYVKAIGVANLETELRGMYQLRLTLPSEKFADRGEAVQELESILAANPSREYLDRWFETKPNASMLEGLKVAAPMSAQTERFDEIIGAIEAASRFGKDAELTALVTMAVDFYPFDFQQGRNTFRENYVENEKIDDAAKVKAISDLYAKYPASDDLQKLVSDAQRWFAGKQKEAQATQMKDLLAKPAAGDATSPWAAYPQFIKVAKAKDTAAYSKLLAEFIDTQKPIYLARGDELTPANVMANRVLYTLPAQNGWNEENRLSALLPLADRIWVGPVIADLMARRQFDDVRKVASAYLSRDVLGATVAVKPADLGLVSRQVIAPYLAASDETKNWDDAQKLLLPLVLGDSVSGSTRLWLIGEIGRQQIHRKGDWGGFSKFLTATVGTLPLDKLAASPEETEKILELYRGALNNDRRPDTKFVTKLNELGKANGITADGIAAFDYKYATAAQGDYRNQWIDEMSKLDLSKLSMDDRRRTMAWEFSVAPHEGWERKMQPGKRNYIAIEQWLPIEREWIASSYSTASTFDATWATPWNHTWAYVQNFVMKDKLATDEWQPKLADMAVFISQNLDVPRGSHLDLSHEGMLALARAKDYKRLLPSVLTNARAVSSVDTVRRVTAELTNLGDLEMLGTYLSIALRANDQLPSEPRKAAEISLAGLSNVLPLYRIPVAQNTPEYGLYMASQHFVFGEIDKANELLNTDNKFQYLPAHWQALNPDFVVYAINLLRTQAEYDKAMNISRTIMLNEKNMPVEMNAGVSLAIADIYRDQKKYDTAIPSYTKITENRQLRDTKSGKDAQFHLIETYMLTSNYERAASILDRLVETGSRDIQGRAYFYLAKLAFIQKDFDLALEKLNEALRINPQDNEAILLRSQIDLEKKNLMSVINNDIGIPLPRGFVTPGTKLDIKIFDDNLGIARANQAIPVLITTTRGDVERIFLRQAEGKKAVFSGTIDVILGKAKKNSVFVELVGDETLTYQIDPDFQKEQKLENHPPSTMTVVSNARLQTSSGAFLSDEERQKKEKEDDLLRASGEISRQDAGRDTKTIRPGNPIYVRVTDPDMGMTEAKDTLYVEVRTATGDVISKFPLVETTEYSGIFEGKVPTAKPLPRADSSDSQEGSEPGWVINSTANKIWESAQKDKNTKWFEVDLQDPQPLASVIATMAGGKQQRVSLLASQVNNDFTEIASFPEVKRQYNGGLDVTSVFDQKAAMTVAGIRANLVNGTPVRGILISSRFERDTFTNLRDQAEEGNVRMNGYFYLDEPRQFSLRNASLTNGQPTTAWAYVDGELIAGPDRTSPTGTEPKAVMLGKGVHQLEVLMYIKGFKTTYEMQYLDDKGNWSYMPKEWFNSELHPELAQAWAPVATLSLLGDNLIAEIKSDKRFRQLRWMFKEYVGDTVSIKKIEVTDRTGKKILPAPEDFSTAMNNQVLEIAPGDDITVTYTDKKRDDFIENETERKLRDGLKSSFYNGSVALDLEVIDEKVNPNARFFPVKRVQNGDNLMVQVEDWDYDATDAKDTLEAVVESDGQPPLKLKLLESEPHSGVFQQVLKFRDVPGDNQVAVKPGSAFTIKYFDGENTIPGVGVDRTYKVFEAGSTTPAVVVLNTETRMENVLETVDRQTQRLSSNSKDRQVLTKQVIATYPSKDELAAPRAAIDAPLLFLVQSPSQAMNELSTIEATVISKSEREAGAEPSKMTMRLQPISSLVEEKGVRNVRFVNIPTLQRLEQGLFAGIVRLQLGKPGDTKDNSVISAASTFGMTSARDRRNKEELSTVPTVLVQGNDQVEITVKWPNGEVTKSVSLYCDGQLNFMDRVFEEDRDGFYLGETLYLRVIDYDLDTTAEYDGARLNLTTTGGDKLTVELKETLAHSGIFTGSIIPMYRKEGEPVNATDEFISLQFGEELTASFMDTNHAAGSEPIERTAKIKVYLGSNGEVSTFSKRFKDEEIAVRTAFTIAEAYFELAKEHRKLDNKDLADQEIDTGKRLLMEAQASYPNTKYASQAEYLLANLAEELGAQTKEYNEAIGRYTAILQSWPDSEYAPKAQFHLALCYEKMDPPHWDAACEEYVKITYKYPDHPLVAEVIIRLGQYFWKMENFVVAGDVFKSFQVRFPDHALATKAMLLSGQSYIKAKDYSKAIDVLNRLCEKYPDDKTTRSEAMYWLGDSYRRTRDLKNAYMTLKKLTWDYPETKWAKMARGLLVGEEFRGMDERME